MNYGMTSIRSARGGLLKLEWHSNVRSTSGIAKQFAESNYPNGYVICADSRYKCDSEGKLTKEIQHGLFMTVLLRPSFFPSQAILLRALAASAFASGLAEYTPKHIGIGWPGSIYCNGVRIGKVSIEGKLNPDTSYEYLLVSFEAIFSDKDFAPRLCDLVAQVFGVYNEDLISMMARKIITAFDSFYSVMKTSTKFMDIYRQRFLFRGKKITYIKDGKKEKRLVLGVDRHSGALMVERKESDRGNGTVYRQSGERDSSENTNVFYITAPSDVIFPKRVKNFNLSE